MRLPQPGMAWAVAILLEVSLVLAAVVDKRQTTASNTVVAERMCYLARPQSEYTYRLHTSQTRVCVHRSC